MSNLQICITVAVLAISVMITRFLPFIIFKESDKLPECIEYLGTVLPAALMGLLVVYCFKDVNVTDCTKSVPAIIAAVSVAAVHLLKRNTILSITAGTAVYMILIRVM